MKFRRLKVDRTTRQSETRDSLPLRPAPTDDHALARDLAVRAGELLVALRSKAGSSAGERWTLRDDGDMGSHHFLVDELRVARPEDRVLSEEGAEDLRRIGAGRVWIVDPLDGTREFGEIDRTDWAVHVALVIDDHLAVGAVSLPAQGLVFSTLEPPVLPPRDTSGPPRMVVSRSRPHPATILAAETLGADLVPMGSAGAKAMAVVRGDVDAYAHAGGQYEWDSAAPAAVAIAAGLHVSGVDGTELEWNKADPWQPHLLICREELAAPVVAAVQAAIRRQPGGGRA
ncbi:MAG: 3'(2'),5'-bisphosphate nucleotidase CysQ [Acidimicrobiia bacterium]|nr:3'(2'),5'-bisphosphate nucleotidase CysQ [Acidimicrobiia bacterium]